MTRHEAEVARVGILAGAMPPGSRPLTDYVEVSVRVKPDDARRTEVVGHRQVQETRTRLVKTPGQPDGTETYLETRTVFDILAH